MQVVTDVQVTSAGLVITRAQMRTETGVPVVTAGVVTTALLAAAFYTFASGDPPTDGSVPTQAYWDLDTDHKFVNIAWPNSAIPQWREA